MRTILRLAGTAIAVGLVLASPTVAVADERPADQDAVTSAEDADAATQDGDVAADDGEAAECDVATTPTEPAGDGTADAPLQDDPGDEVAPAQPCATEAPVDEQQPDEAPSTDPTADPGTDPTADPGTDPAPDSGTDPAPDPTGDPAADADGQDGAPSTDAPGEPSTDVPADTSEETVAPPEPGHVDEPGQVDEPVGLPADPAAEAPAAEPATAPEAAPEAAPIVEAPPAETPSLDRPAPAAPIVAPPAATTADRPATSPVVTGALRAAATTTAPLAVLGSVPAGPSPLTVPFATVDAFPAYQPQAFCDPTPKPGTEYLARLAISYFGAGHLAGISRDCSVGPTSEHKEGRAFDWALRVGVPEEKAAGDAFAQWLTAVGPDGKVGYNARRLGVMYVIWNGQIWMNDAADASWQPYYGPSPHTDHVHVSLTWAGAYERTSWWTADPLPDRVELARLASQAWARVFGHEPDAGVLDAWLSHLLDGGALPVTGPGLSRIAEMFAVVLDVGRWGLDRTTPMISPEDWVETTGMPLR